MRKRFQKKRVWLVAASALAVSLSGCSGPEAGPEQLDQAGIAPYELTERETYLLQSLGMETYSQILSYRAPEGARSLDVRVYQLTPEGSWEETDSGGISVGETEAMLGTFTLQLQKDHVLAIHLNADGGLYSFDTSPVEPESVMLGSQICFLRQEVPASLEGEIPVAMLAYTSANQMESLTLEDFANPEGITGMDLVQAVTITFSGQEL